eukprot:10859911-Alexandrium_andersonii.AAC.1
MHHPELSEACVATQPIDPRVTRLSPSYGIPMFFKYGGVLLGEAKELPALCERVPCAKCAAEADASLHMQQCSSLRMDVVLATFLLHDAAVGEVSAFLNVLLFESNTFVFCHAHTLELALGPLLSEGPLFVVDAERFVLGGLRAA